MGKEDQRLGKKGEFRVFGELLARDLTVYYPLFDVEGIDCIVRNKSGKHIDIQIKTRKEERLWDVPELKPREDLFIVLYVTETGETKNDKFWVLPSEDFVKFSRTHIVRNKKIYRLQINKSNEDELQKYTGDVGFNRIVNFGRSEKSHNQIKNHVATKKHISVPHYKMEDFYPLIIEILKAQNAPLKRKEIVAKVEEQIYDKLSDADKDILKGGNQRWKETLLWAITNLAKQKIIISKSKNQWELNNNK